MNNSSISIRNICCKKWMIAECCHDTGVLDRCIQQIRLLAIIRHRR